MATSLNFCSRLPQLRIYVIIDAPSVNINILHFVESLIDANVRCIQLRDKLHSKKEIEPIALRISTMTSEAGALFFVNDYADLADFVGASGVHVGLEDSPVAEVRKSYPNLLVGASARTVADARLAEENGAVYIGCGPIWDATASKINSPKPIGLQTLLEVSKAVSIPVFGIGGINADNAQQVIEHGAAGVAVIRAVLPENNMHSDDFAVKYKVECLRSALNGF